MKVLHFSFILMLASSAMLVLLPAHPAEAYTRWSGQFFLADTAASSAGSSTNLFQGGVNLSILPPTKKNLQTRFSARFDYTNADGEELWNVSPVGNLGVDLAGESFALHLQHLRSITVTTAAELVDSTTFRAAFSLFPRDLPRLSTSFSTQETTVGAVSTTSDTFTLASDYVYRWLNVRGSLSTQSRESGGRTSSSDSMFFGVGGSYEILPRTLLTADLDLNRFSTEAGAGAETVALSRGFRAIVNSRPSIWLSLSGTFTRDDTKTDSGTGEIATASQYADATATLYPIDGMRFYATVGDRTFDDQAGRRSIDFATLGASLGRRLQEAILLNLNLSRTIEADPDRRENVRDNAGINAVMDLTPRVSLRASLSVSRNEVPAFVSRPQATISGTLEERDTLELEANPFGLPAGSTFFDIGNNDLYTKNSSTPGDWSAPVHLDSTTESFSISKSIQMNTRPTDKTSLAISYSSSAAGERLDILEPGSQTLNGALTYQANLRTSYGISGTAAFPKSGANAYSGTGSFAYRFRHRHQLNLSYGLRTFAGTTSDTFSSSLRLALPKRSNLDLTYAASQLFEEEQTDFFQVRFSHSF